MRYPAAEKLEIIQLVEQSHLPVRRSLRSSTGSTKRGPECRRRGTCRPDFRFGCPSPRY